MPDSTPKPSSASNFTAAFLKALLVCGLIFFLPHLTEALRYFDIVPTLPLFNFFPYALSTFLFGLLFPFALSPAVRPGIGARTLFVILATPSAAIGGFVLLYSLLGLLPLPVLMLASVRYIGLRLTFLGALRTLGAVYGVQELLPRLLPSPGAATMWQSAPFFAFSLLLCLEHWHASRNRARRPGSKLKWNLAILTCAFVPPLFFYSWSIIDLALHYTGTCYVWMDASVSASLPKCIWISLTNVDGFFAMMFCGAWVFCNLLLLRLCGAKAGVALQGEETAKSSSRPFYLAGGYAAAAISVCCAAVALGQWAGGHGVTPFLKRKGTVKLELNFEQIKNYGEPETRERLIRYLAASPEWRLSLERRYDFDRPPEERDARVFFAGRREMKEGRYQTVQRVINAGSGVASGTLLASIEISRLDDAYPLPKPLMNGGTMVEYSASSVDLPIHKTDYQLTPEEASTLIIYSPHLLVRVDELSLDNSRTETKAALKRISEMLAQVSENYDQALADIPLATEGGFSGARCYYERSGRGPEMKFWGFLPVLRTGVVYSPGFGGDDPNCAQCGEILGWSEEGNKPHYFELSGYSQPVVRFRPLDGSPDTGPIACEEVTAGRR